MNNGKYIAELKAYPGSKRRINVFQGKASIYTLQGVFVCDVTEDVITSEYMKIEKAPAPLYNVVWMVQGEIKEIVKENLSFALCKHHINKLKCEARYKLGLLMPAQSQLS